MIAAAIMIDFTKNQISKDSVFEKVVTLEFALKDSGMKKATLLAPKGKFLVSFDDGLATFPAGKSIDKDTKLGTIRLGLVKDGTWIAFVPNTNSEAKVFDEYAVEEPA